MYQQNILCASVALVPWLSKYSKCFETASHTVHTCSLSRFMCDFEKYDQSKYSSKLFALIRASECFPMTSGKAQPSLDFNLL